jgi:AcrR family transcriptional regulator
MTEKRRRPGGRSAEVRRSTLNAARELYASGGFLPTLSEIATRAGVQRSTLYRRWGGAEAILLEAVGEDVRSLIPVPNKGSLRQDLAAFARATYRFHGSRRGKHLVAMLLGAPDHVKQAYWSERYGGLQKIFENAARRKEIAPQEDWRFYLDLFIAPFYFCTWGKAERWDAYSAERTLELICSALLR